jgi:hypothetical protein
MDSNTILENGRVQITRRGIAVKGDRAVFYEFVDIEGIDVNISMPAFYMVLKRNWFLMLITIILAASIFIDSIRALLSNYGLMFIVLCLVIAGILEAYSNTIARRVTIRAKSGARFDVADDVNYEIAKQIIDAYTLAQSSPRNRPEG